MKKSVFLLLVASVLGFSAEVQQCNNAIERSAPNVRFVNDDEKGITKDLRTGLTWYRCALGRTWNKETKTCNDLEDGKTVKFNWSQTLLNVKDFNKSDTNKTGISTWRLPNIKELVSIKENACTKPSLNSAAFPNFVTKTAYDVENYIWSSSKDPDSNYAKYFAAAFNQLGASTLDSEQGAMLVADIAENQEDSSN